jgi:transcriptional regulator with XRE-family HTH domain
VSSFYLSTGIVLSKVMSIVSAKHVRFGKRIKELRIVAGITQDGLAAKIDMDRSYVGFIERGERNPSLEVVFNIAMALGVKPVDLLKDIS